MKVSLDDFLQLLNEEFPGKGIGADTKVAETGIDSLDLADIVFKMEDKFGALSSKMAAASLVCVLTSSSRGSVLPIERSPP